MFRVRVIVRVRVRVRVGVRVRLGRVLRLGLFCVLLSTQQSVWKVQVTPRSVLRQKELALV
jgi:hypothetical protein